MFIKNKTPNLKNLFSWLLVIIAIFNLQVQCQLTASIYQSANLISSTSNHQVTVTFQNTEIFASSYILLQYSNAWVISGITGGNLTSDFCETGCTLSSVSITLNATAKTIKINNLFPRYISPGQTVTIRYTLRNFFNPSYVINQNVFITLYDNTAVLIDFTNSAQLYTYAKQITCSVSRSNSFVAAVAEYRFTANPNPLVIPANVYIMMVFPSSWASSSTNDKYNPLTSSCRGAVNPLISCPIANGNLNVSNILSASTSSSFSFNVTQITNPGSEENNIQLILNFYSSSGQIAYCNAPITGTIANSIPDLIVNMTGDMGDLIVGIVSFTILQLSKTTDILQIQLPIQYDCSRLYTSYFYLNNETANQKTNLHVNYTSGASNVITLMPFFTNPIALYRIQLYNIQLPKTTALIPQTKVSIFRDGALIASQQCCSTSYPLLVSTSGIYVTLASSLIGSVTTHYINIQNSTAFSFPNDYKYIIIQFDSNYSLLNPTYNCYIKDSLALVHPLVCTRNTTTRIMISNLNSGANIGDNLFTLGIDSITTPITLESLRLTILTLDGNYNGIQNITTYFTLTSTKINNVRVIPTSLTTYSIATYQFKITNTNSLGIGTVVFILFPPQIQLNSTTSCYINNTLIAIANCIVDRSNSSANKVRLKIGNALSITAYNLNQTNISITQVTNPLSIMQTSTFHVQLITSAGDIVQQLKQGISVIMTTPSNVLSYFSIVVNDNHTMAVTNYTIQYQLPIDIIQIYGASSSYVTNGINIKITFPNEFSCLSYSSTQACMVSGQLTLFAYNIVTTSNLTSSSFVIRNMQNPSVASISANIIVTLYLSNYLSIQYTYNSLNSFSPNIISYGFTQSNYYLGEYSQAQISINSVTNLQLSTASKQIVIIPPTQYAADNNLTVSCNQPGVTITKTINSSQLKMVRISNFISIVNLTIFISNIINPSSVPISSKWTVQLRDFASDGLIANSNLTTDPSFNSVCNSPCRSCTSNTSYCLSCYTNLSLIMQKYLDTTSQTCINSCLSSQFTTGMICSACSSQCQTCVGVSYNCTSCSAASSTYLYLPTNQCIVQCPPEYYENSTNRQCTACLAPCLYCTGTTGSICTYCTSSYVLTVYVNSTTTCTNSCSPGYFNYSNICTLCPSTCTSCQSTNQCSVCTNGYYLYAGVCLANCPSNLYISISSGNLTCQTCQLPCSTCYNYSTNCSSCNTIPANINKFLMSSGTTTTCTNSCALGQYPNEYYQCIRCVLPCALCSSATTCLQCITGYHYYPNTQQCFSTCPNKTILVIATQQCQKCNSPCLQCTSTITNCTSCIQGYFYDSIYSTCNITCSLPYFAINRLCTRCAIPCSTCVPLQPYTCLTCISSYVIYGTTCYMYQCPDGSYKSSSTLCSPCTSGCLTCVNTSSTCLSCYPGLYLYMQSCIANCPTTPIHYFQYQMQCIICNPLCFSCLSTSQQCSSCVNSSLYLNEQTRQCTVNCTNPYFTGVNASNPFIKLCLKCQLPCKTCLSNQTQCSSCHNGYYLYNQQCVQTCITSTYPDTKTNICQVCSNFCIKCTSYNSCKQCQSGTYSFQGGCYTICPASSPYVYKNKYCRNCLLDNCLLCDLSQTQLKCFLCQSGYYLSNQKCTSDCPDGYQPDTVTLSLCMATEQKTLLLYFEMLQKFKIYLFPGFIWFISSILFTMIYIYSLEDCCDSENKLKVNKDKIIWLNLLLCIISFPQVVTLLTYLIYLIINPETYFHSELFNYVYYIIFALFYLLNLTNFLIVVTTFKKDKIFIQWSQDKQNKNYHRYIIVMTASLIFNKNLCFLLFSGVWRIPITCCRISALTQQVISKKLKIIRFISILLIQIPIIAYVLYTLLVENYVLNNYKLFFGSIDIVTINLFCITIQIVFLVKTFTVPTIYSKFILEKVSNLSLPALSIQQPEEEQNDDNLQLHRSNSTQGLKKQSQQMKQVEFKSVFDPSDFENPDYIQSTKIQNALNQGKFRKKNLKKKKKGNKWQMDIIDQESQQSKQKMQSKPKKKNNNNKKKVGYMNNYIYWKPPEKIQKKKPEKQFKLHQKQIMQTIRQKQSNFDTITHNDIIFREEPFNQNSSHDSDPNFEIQDSRRALNFQYQAFLNKNYASKKHLL